MKTIARLISLVLVAAMMTAGCNKVSYRKTKGGMPYKLFPGNGKDSLIKPGEIAKFQVTTQLNDSSIYSSYGKLPAYAKLILTENSSYNLLEILPLMRKGDSAIIVQLVDTLMKQGIDLPISVLKGDRLKTTIMITEVFRSDSIAMADYKVELERDRPRQMKVEQEQMAQMEKAKLEQELKEDMEMEKSGEIKREIEALQSWLAAKKINAQKTGKGTFVFILQKGDGAPASPGKYVTIKYTGKIFATDSTFQSSSYSFQLGRGAVIRGWDEGLQLFRQGGKGTLFIPGFLAYGRNPPLGSPFKPNEALKFDVELMNVSDTLITH